MCQLFWTNYNETVGTVHPAIGELDGDSAEELVPGLADGGYVEFREDLTNGPAHSSWGRVQWNGCNSSTGEDQIESPDRIRPRITMQRGVYPRHAPIGPPHRGSWKPQRILTAGTSDQSK